MKNSYTFQLDAQNFIITDEGYLKAKAFLTRTGIFDYYEGTRKIRRLRPSEEVFNTDSMKSLELKPVTFNHPKDLIDSSNTGRYVVGFVGNDIRQENDKLAATIIITSKPVVEHIMKLKDAGQAVELSCGYRAQLTDETGVASEGNYDQVQRNIRYNHVSIVPSGRAGSEIKILLDNMEKDEMDEKTKIMLDEANKKAEEIQAQFDESVKKAEELESNVKTLTDEKETLKAQLDAKTEEIKVVKDSLEKWQNPESAEVKAMMDGYNKVMDVAKTLEVETKEKSIGQIKIDCIKAHRPLFDSEGKEEAYIMASFDVLCDSLEEIKTEKANKKIADIKNIKLKDSKKEPEKSKVQLHKEELENLHNKK